VGNECKPLVKIKEKAVRSFIEYQDALRAEQKNKHLYLPVARIASQEQNGGIKPLPPQRQQVPETVLSLQVSDNPVQQRVPLEGGNDLRLVATKDCIRGVFELRIVPQAFQRFEYIGWLGGLHNQDILPDGMEIGWSDARRRIDAIEIPVVIRRERMPEPEYRMPADSFPRKPEFVPIPSDDASVFNLQPQC
jgi:hypothetical protein